MERPLRKVVWAVDAFDAKNSLQKTAARVLEALSQRFSMQVHPVYVLNAAQLSLPDETGGPLIHLYVPAAEKALAESISHHSIAGMQVPHIIFQKTSSKVEAADLVSDYGLKLGADVILVGTHGRSGVSRLLLGSFAETLLMRSKVPVLVVGPEIGQVNTVDHITFPTEFGSHARKVFRKVVEIARDFGAGVTLAHCIPHPIEPIFQSGVYLLGGSWVPVRSYFEEEISRQTRRAEEWARWAEHQGVKTDFVVESVVGNIPLVIVEIAKRKNSSCILMEAQSGPISAAFIGSTTRQVVRNAHCPVWVIRNTMWTEDKQRVRKPAA